METGEFKDGLFRDAVDYGCDTFSPTTKPAVPLGPGTVFTEFKDLHQSRVRLSLSSAAAREACRVFIDPHPRFTAQPLVSGGMTHPAWEPTSLHLCRCMAAELRKALDAAFDGTLDEQPMCPEKRPLPPDNPLT